jgi:phage-related baseplate assembly protein
LLMALKPRFNLPDISFVEKSPEQIEAELVSFVEGKTGLKLLPADPRRKFIQAVAAWASQQRVNIDYAAKQNLLAYAVDEFLDHFGESRHTPRIQAKAASTTQRFYFSITRQQIIPAGTRVTAGDGMFFATTAAVTVKRDQTYADVTVVCTEPGAKGNGYAVGQLNQMVDPLPWVTRTENVTVTSGGADAEENDPYAERIRLAPESFSTAGPELAYVYWAKTASADIVDVLVDSPSPGKIEIRPLLKDGGIPDQAVLDAVAATCNDRRVRPLTDFVQVLAPQAVSYDINLNYWISSADASLVTSIQEKVTESVETYKTWQKSKLGRNIDPSELVYLVKQAGAKRVEVIEPLFKTIEKHQVAVENTVTVTFGGLEDE